MIRIAWLLSMAAQAVFWSYFVPEQPYSAVLTACTALATTAVFLIVDL